MQFSLVVLFLIMN